MVSTLLKTSDVLFVRNKLRIKHYKAKCLVFFCLELKNGIFLFYPLEGDVT